ncbi:hypothetical protein LUZ60_012191 [Juncus effusus]|nr:hypothetical protein LUZ60_012191 [Juncus effusus]
MSVLLFVERVYMAIVIMFVKVLGKKRYTKYKLDEVRKDLETGGTHPTVLVQIPMFNEKEVYRLSIGAVCAMSWPSNKIIIQVLDDSTDLVIRELVELECNRWASKGVNIKYENRSNRNGYKAGAMRDGLKKYYVNDCEYVAIFDADFQPDTDFLWRTIPFLLSNPDLALVQARWKFVNSNECLLTRLQEMSLDYHFGVEQEVGSSTYSFFGFNGTAGVWRLKALKDAGGWKERTTVEDMDLAVRASLKGWKFVFIGDLMVKNELPSTFKAYRFQQHRSLHLLIFWILFENVMSMHRSKATIIGLLEASRVNEWVVTEKLGSAGKPKPHSKWLKRPHFRLGERIHMLELLMGSYLLYCAIYDVMYGRDHFYVYLFLQSGAAFIVGFGYVGTFMPN